MRAFAAVVYQSSYPGPCSERALVLRSQGIESEVIRDDGVCLLVVAEEDSQAARRELTDYAEENTGWPPRSAPLQYDYFDAWAGVLAYVVVISLAFWVSTTGPGGGSWYLAGKVDAGLIRDGEWWRTITALTLHIDIAHLASNLLFGSAFGYIAGRYFGWGIAWLVILLAGAAGNALNSVLLAPSHTSVGASTAIFAALGMVASFLWRLRQFPSDSWAMRVATVVAGIAMLAYFGTGGERTDVSAHITGFVCGFGAGLLLALVRKKLPRRAGAQWQAGLTALAILFAAWWMALTA